jgi:hypothetical protein
MGGHVDCWNALEGERKQSRIQGNIMSPKLNVAVLERQNEEFSGTGGRSQENRVWGFRPAFMDAATRVIYRSCFADGTWAPVHLLDGLPDEVVASRDVNGRVVAVKASIVAGFVLDGYFYSREEAARAMSSSVCA